MSDLTADNWHGTKGTGAHRPTGLRRAYCALCGWCYREDWCPCCRRANGQVQVWVDPTEFVKRVVDLVDGVLLDEADRGLTLMAVSNGMSKLIGVQDE